MGRKYKRLFDQIITHENFMSAYEKTRKGKSRSFSYLEFKEYAELNVESLRQQVADQAYVMSDFRQFWIYDPKLRLISGLPFKDRVVQHALNNVLEPIFDRTMLPYTYACRRGGGLHAGVKHIQSAMRRHETTHFLKTDYSKYFPSVVRPRLYELIEAKVKCPRTLWLKETITPRNGVGLHIGSLASQLDANLYGTQVDQLLQHEIKPIAWARYMDDIVLLGKDPQFLRDAKDRMEAHAATYMGMRFSKWMVAPVSRGVNFLGYRIWPRHKLLRKQSVQRAKRKIKAMTRRGDHEALQRFLSAWTGHARWADVENLFSSMEINNGCSN
jgi:hypothetical protein